MDIISFRTLFKAFSNEQEYPEDFLKSWNEMAAEYLKRSWLLSGKAYDHALLLMTAHLIALSEKAKNGDNSSGAVQSATEGSVSVSFTAPPAQNAWQFWLSSTPYGVQLWAFLKAKSAGGIYIGGLPERQAVRKVSGVFI